jgi:hypothetical protein
MFHTTKWNKNFKIFRNYVRDENLRKNIQKMINLNSLGKVSEAVETYEDFIKVFQNNF